MTTTRYTIDLGNRLKTTFDPSQAARYSQRGYSVNAEVIMA
jgi:hypothetical protein